MFQPALVHGDKNVLNILANRPSPMLGIDINPQAINILEISKSQTQRSVQSYGFARLTPSMMKAHLITDLNQMAKTIQDIVQKKSIQCRKVAIALPDSSVFTKVIQVNNALQGEELEAFITLNAAKFIPYPPGDFYLDFVVRGLSQKNPDTREVLIAAAPLNLVQNRLEVIKRAGLCLERIDLESTSLIRAFHDESKTKAIIDIGLHWLRLMSFQDGRLVCHTEAVFEQKSIEAVKQVLLLQNELKAWCAEGHIQSINLSGTLARLPDLPAFLEANFGLSSQVVEPFKGMSFGPNVDSALLNEAAPSLLVACGLALSPMM